MVKPFWRNMLEWILLKQFGSIFLNLKRVCNISNSSWPNDIWTASLRGLANSIDIVSRELSASSVTTLHLRNRKKSKLNRVFRDKYSYLIRIFNLMTQYSIRTLQNIVDHSMNSIQWRLHMLLLLIFLLDSMIWWISQKDYYIHDIFVI